MRRIFIPLVIFILLLSACSSENGALSTPPPIVVYPADYLGQATPSPAPAEPALPTPTPAPVPPTPAPPAHSSLEANGGAYAEPTPTPTPAPTPMPLSNELTIAMRLPQTLNPLLNTCPSVGLALGLLFEPLAVIGEGLRPVPNPAITESINISADAAFVTLRHGARWSDGTPIRAQDIVFSINFLKNAPDGVLYKHLVENILSAEVVDNQTARLVLTAPTGQTAYFLNFPIIPQHHFSAALNPESAANHNPAGSGAFRFEYRHFSRYISLAPNEHALQPPNIERAIILLTPDDETDVHAITQNVIQAHFLEFFDRRVFRDLPNVTAREFVSRNYEFIGFNHASPLFQDINVRQAVAHSVSPEQIDRDAFAGSLFPAPAFVPSHSWLFEPEARQPAFDLEAASDALRASAFSPHQYILNITILVNNNYERLLTAQILSDNLNEIGFRAQIDAVPFEQYIERLAAGDFDLFIGGLSLPQNSNFADGLTALGLYASAEYLTAALSAETLAEYQTAMSAFQQHITNEIPLAGLGFRSSALLTRTHINNANPSPTHIFRGVGNWYIN